MNYTKINNITGWLVFLIATTVYILTLEPTGSFWDCGEFISTSYKLGVPHPPGAPLFLLLGRIFSFFAMGDTTRVAYWINMCSALSSSFTILFLFWTITMLAKKVIKPETNQYSIPQIVAIMGSGIVGSLAFAFSDSFWFSSEEAEVYAMSSFFTAIVFWAILKWESKVGEPGADRWLLIMAYLVGLSIGVHLLNLVALPAIGMIYYYKKYPADERGVFITFFAGISIIIVSILAITADLAIISLFLTIGGVVAAYFRLRQYRREQLGIILTLGISAILIVLVMSGVITGLPSIASSFEVIFKNSLGMPFGTGIIIFCLLLFGGLGYGLYYSVINKKILLNISLLGLLFILIGYSSYGVIVIRSQFQPTIDMNDPENIMSFTSYLKREQYGDRPLLNGPVYTAARAEYGRDFNVVNEAPLYRKAADEYKIYDYKKSYDYDKKYTMFFPRMYSTQPQHIEEYKRIMNIKSDRKPTQAENIGYMVKHQIGFFWGRYFLWNFVGRAGSDYGSGSLWFSDWNATDKASYIKKEFNKNPGDSLSAQEASKIASKSFVPSQILKDKARNNYYMLPLFFGLLGLVFHFSKDVKNASVVLLFFFFTGIAIVIYLNQPPVEPRERDYTHVGSFYAFSIWIGFSVLLMYELFAEFLKKSIVAPVLATIICLVVPGIMVAEGWDDHDRSKRFHSVDSAINLLNSCAPNAILFTGGDNDTYPLWYAQEVEGIRTDVRVCNLSLLNTDWYINQMRRKAYLSQPLPITLKEERYLSGSNDMIYYVENPKYKDGISLPGFIKEVNVQGRVVTQTAGGGEIYSTYPSKNFILPVNKVQILKLGIVDTSMTDYIVSQLAWNIGANSFDKKSLIILDMIANNNWERPIYFSTTLSGEDYLNLKEYMQLEGLAYRLLPVKVPGKTGWVNSKIMYDNMMKRFAFRNMQDSTIFYDENYLRFPANARNQYHALAAQLLTEGDTAKAKEVLNYSLAMMPDNTIPYDYYMPEYISLLYKVGEDKKAEHIANTMGQRALEMLEYMDKNRMSANSRDYQFAMMYLQQIVNGLRDAGKMDEALRYYGKFNYYLQKNQ